MTYAHPSAPPGPSGSSPLAHPETSLPLRTRLAAGVGLAVSRISRRLGRGGGSVIGGRFILAMDPRALQHLSAGRSVVLVSGTNGKTTTTSMLAAALGTAGPVVTNVQGANLPPGLAAALAGPAPRGGAPSVPGSPASGTDVCVLPAALEVDEAWLSRVVEATAPRAVALLNLSRDQLDRNNEVRTLAAAWRRTLEGRAGLTVVANADDPLVVWGAGLAPTVRWVGAGQPWTDDAGGCPSCGSRIDFSLVDGWGCHGCGLRRPPLDAELDDGCVRWADGVSVRLNLQLPGRANQANAAMALTLAAEAGADRQQAAAALATLTEVVGRYAVVGTASGRARLLLAKNPAGWLEVFDFLRPAPLPVVVAINARTADGRDPSWLWDVPFERLRGRLVVATGERSRDLAVRLHYAEVHHVHEPDLVKALSASGEPDVDVVANYTSFQQLRTRLAASTGA